MTKPAVGIDFGATYCRVGVFKDGKFDILADDQGKKSIANVVGFTASNFMIGEKALEQATENSANTVFGFKRLLGLRFGDASVQADVKYFPFKVIGDGGKSKIEVEFKSEVKKFSPEFMSAIVLMKLKHTAETVLGEEVKDVVVTVPTNFDNGQRQAIIDAGKIAGLNVSKIISESMATAIAFGIEKKGATNHNVLIFDLGGGKFDVSILTLDDGVIQMKSTAGDTHLGGQDFDTRLLNYLVAEFKRKFKKDLTRDSTAMRRLRIACEEAKRKLSTESQVSIQLDALYENVDFHTTITQSRFNELIYDLVDRIMHLVEKALDGANMDNDQIHDVVLIGGSTRIPKIRQRMKEFFNLLKLKSIDADEAVVYGAAIQAAILVGEKLPGGQDLLLLDATPLGLNMESVGGLMPISCKPRTAQSIGSLHPVFDRNTIIPAKSSLFFNTYLEGQPGILIQIYEGEGAKAKQNLLGKFWIFGQPNSREIAEIDVTFDLDANGILKLSAKDGKNRKLDVLVEKFGLTEAEIDEAKIDAEEFMDPRSRVGKKLEFFNDVVESMVEDGKLKENLEEAQRQSILVQCIRIARWLKMDHTNDDSMTDQTDYNSLMANLQKITGGF